MTAEGSTGDGLGPLRAERCSACDYALAGLPPTGVCPECGVTYALGRVLEDDRPCMRCGYSLRGLSDAGVCPECGSPVVDSLRGNLLAYSSPEYLGQLTLGARLVWWSIAAILIGIVAGVLFNAAPASFSAVLGPLISIAASALGLAGWWLLSTPDPAAGADRDARARRVLRAAVVVSAACFLVNTVIALSLGVRSPGFLGFLRAPAAPQSAGQAVSAIAMLLAGIASLVANVAWLVQFFAAMVYLRAVAPRVPDMKIASRARVLMWFMGTIVAMIVLMFLIALILAAVTQSGNAMLGLMLPACLLGVAFLVWFVLYIGLIDRIKRRLVELRRAQAAAAATPGAAARTTADGRG